MAHFVQYTRMVHDTGWLAISREAKAMAPVFIIGEARSGSTIFYRTLLKHPSFAPREETLQETSFIRQAPLAFQFAEDRPRNLRRYMLEDDDCWRAFLDSLDPVRPLLRVASGIATSDGEYADWLWQLAPSRLAAR